VVYSIEMPARELGHRLIASEANIPHQKWVSAKGLQVDEAKRAEAAILKVRSWPLIIDSPSSLSLPQLRARARRIVTERGKLGVIIVDYLQLMRSGERHGSREEEVATVSRGLKALAKELDVPVIALAQLNRS